MKKILTFLPMVFLLLLALQNVEAQQQTIAGWAFPSLLNQNVVAADCGNGTLYADGTHSSSVWTVTTNQNSYGLYYNFAGVAPATALCDVTSAGKCMSANGQENNDSSWVFVVSTTDFMNIQMSFNHRGSSAGFKTQTWSHSSDGVNFTIDTVMTGMNTGTSSSFAVVKGFSLSADANNQETLYIKVTFGGATGSAGNNRMDNICISGESNLPVTATPTFTPAGGLFCDATNVALTCYTEGATIYYTTDGSEPNDETGILYTEPILVDATMTIRAIAYAEGLDASAVQVEEYTLPTVVSTIAEFLENTTDTYFKITGDVTVIHKTGSYLFVQDNTAASCIYGTGLTAYASGTVLSGGFCATRGTYYGMAQLTNPELGNITATPGTAVEPLELTVAELNANFSDYNCKLVSISNANFGRGGTFSTSINSIFPLFQNGDTIICANQFSTISNFTTPTNMCNVTGIAIPHDETHRLCPRGTYDIVEMIPSISITAPEEDAVFEQGDPISLNIETNFFNLENGNMIRASVQQNNITVVDTFLHNDTEVADFESIDLYQILNNVGDYMAVASLLDADTNVLKADTVFFSIIEAYIAIETSENILNFYENGETHTFTATAFRLHEDISITVDDPNFEVTPMTLAADANNATVTVAFVGTESATATLTLTSDTTVATVALIAEIPIDTLIYSTGFEVSDGFDSTSNNYSNDNPAYFGPTGRQWGTIHGAVTTTDAMMGAQSMQMRYYGSSTSPHNGHEGYVYTHFDLHNVTKVEFSAKNNGSLQLRASYSHDGGRTWEGDSLFAITTNVGRYTYNITDSGQYYSVRIKFEYVIPTPAPTNTPRLTIDSVAVYGVTGLEPMIVENPVISVPTGSFLTPITVDITCETEDAEIRYTTNGVDPTEDDSLYTAPLTIGTTCTLKARAFKGGMDPSNVVFEEYTFPTEVATIAEFKAAAANAPTANYKITGDVTFVYRNSRRIFIEDATGGLLVYDNSTPVVTGTYNEGDVISGGIIGSYSLYAGMNEMIPLADWAAASGHATVTPVVATIEDITTDFDTYEARLVRINALHFAEAITFTTSDQEEVEVSDENDESIMIRNQFFTLDTTIAADANADVIGLAAIFVNDDETTYQVFPRTNADIIEVDTTDASDTIGLNEVERLNVIVYPNPTKGEITLEGASAGSQIVVLNAVGQIVYRTENLGSHATISLSNQPSGLYFIRVINADKRVAVIKVTKL